MSSDFVKNTNNKTEIWKYNFFACVEKCYRFGKHCVAFPNCFFFKKEHSSIHFYNNVIDNGNKTYLILKSLYFFFFSKFCNVFSTIKTIGIAEMIVQGMRITSVNIFLKNLLKHFHTRYLIYRDIPKSNQPIEKTFSKYFYF